VKQKFRLLALVIIAVSCCSGLHASDTETADGVITVSNPPTHLVGYEQRILGLERQLAEMQSEGASDESFGCECNTCCASWFATADYLIWQIERNDLAFAIRDPAGLGVPAGGQPVQSLDLGSNNGLRFALGRRTDDNWEVAVKYTFMRADDNRIFAPGAGQVLAVQSSPATGLTNANSANASSNFRYNVFDLQMSHWFNASDTLSLNVFSGVRFSSIDHHLRVRYDGGAFINGLVDVPTDVDAFGIRLGSELHANLASGLAVFGRAGLSANATEITATRREVNAGAVVIDAGRSTHPVIPALEVALGLRFYSGNWSVAAGYEFENWFNLVSPLEFADNFNGGTLGSSQQDLGLHGAFFSAAYAY
jgi:hypothetical protein